MLGFEVVLCEVLRLFEGCFEGVSSVALRVVLSVVLRLFEGCFEGCFEVVEVV